VPGTAALRDCVGPAAGGLDRLTAARSLTVAVARGAGWDLPSDLRAGAGAVHDGLARLELPAAWCTPYLLGALYEATLPAEARATGAHYTAPEIAAGVVGLVGPLPPPPGRGATPGTTDGSGPVVWDPACGGGAFLLAAADALLGAGHRPERVVAELIWGTDLDPGAVTVAEAALVFWAWRHGVPVARPGRHLVVADALLAPRPGPPEGFDLVVGNPPFQGQLTGGAVRTNAERVALQAAWGGVVGPYTDTAALFLVAGVRALAPGGALAMVQPTSVLSARDAGPARAAATAGAELVGLWVAVEPVFDAAVDVCAPVLRRPVSDPTGAEHEPETGIGDVDTVTAGPVPSSVTSSVTSSVPVRRWRGRSFEPLPGPYHVPPATGSRGSPAPWSALALGALGVPDPTHRSGGRLGDLATASAGFRDEYYGLVDHVHEAPVGGDLPDHLAPLVTSGLVDPGRCAWGGRRARFGGRSWDRPVVDRRTLAGAGGRAAAWAASTAAPKVVVASQTRVGEAAVDERGSWVASTPAVVVRADPDRLWEVAAVICSPVASAVLLAATAGSGRSADAIRPTVHSVLDLPLPIDGEAWRLGAAALRAGDLDTFATAMATAYGRPAVGPLEAWWHDRLPSIPPLPSRPSTPSTPSVASVPPPGSEPGSGPPA
jgi:hypothetical protein